MISRAGVAALALLAGAVVGTIATSPVPRLVWNTSESAPVGFYLVSPEAAIAAGDMVVARTPRPFRRLAAVRRYLPENVPLVKRVAAVAGQRVCARGAFVTVDERPVVIRRPADAAGRAMPWWRGCVRLREGSVLLLMDRSDSFDGRYFGPTEAGDVIGRAKLLWAG